MNTDKEKSSKKVQQPTASLCSSVFFRGLCSSVFFCGNPREVIAASVHLCGDAAFAAAALLRRGLSLRELDETERTIGKVFAHQRGRHVVDGHVGARAAFRRAMVRVAVEHGADGKARDRLLEAAAAEERVDVAGLAFDGSLDRRVV